MSISLLARFATPLLRLVGIGSKRAGVTAGKAATRTAKVGAAGLLGAGFIKSIPSLFNTADEKDKNTNKAIQDSNIRRPEVTSTEIKPNDVPQKALSATLQFSKYIEDTTEKVRPIRAIGKTLPEIKANKKYSPIMTEIIDNINNVKKRVNMVEKKIYLHTSLLLKLRSASTVLSDKMQEYAEENRDNIIQQQREKDEQEIEIKGIGRFQKIKDFAYDNVFERTKDYVSNLKDMIVTVLKTFSIPAGLLTLGFLSDMASANDGEKGETLSSTETGGAGLLGTAAATRAMTRTPRGTVTQQRGTLERKNLARHKMKVRSMKSTLSRLKKLPYIGTFAGIASSILIFDAIMSIFDRLEINDISEEEAEQQIKEQLAILVNDLGGAFLGAYIGGLLGGKVGGAAGMLLGPGGAAVAGLGGLGIGSYIGYKAGLEFMRQSGAGEMLVNAFYDYILGSDSLLRRVWEEMTKFTMYSSEELIRQGYSPDMSPAEMIVRSTEQRRITDEQGNEIRYKSTLSMFGVDEKGILTGLIRIKTPDEYREVKRQVEEMLGEENFEDFLSDSLTREEMAIVVESMKQSMLSNKNLRPEDVTQFFQEISTNSEIFKAVSPEFFDMIKKGNAVPVILADGTRTVMTVEEIQNALIPDAQRVRLLNRAEEQRQVYERLLRQQAGSNRLITEEEFNNAVSDEIFRNALQLRTTPRNPQTSIVPVVMPNPMMNQTGGSLNQSKSSNANPNPSSVTTDSFLGNLGFTT